MAKLTESYLRGMIKQVMNEMSTFSPRGVSQISLDSTAYGGEAPDATNLFKAAQRLSLALNSGDTSKINAALEEVEQLRSNLSGFGMKAFQGLQQDLDELISQAELEVGMPGGPSTDPHLSPTMDESRRSKRK